MRQGEIGGSRPADSDRLLLLRELPRSRKSLRAAAFRATANLSAVACNSRRLASRLCNMRSASATVCGCVLFCSVLDFLRMASIRSGEIICAANPDQLGQQSGAVARVGTAVKIVDVDRTWIALILFANRRTGCIPG